MSLSLCISKCYIKVTSASLGYPLSVFNKNSTLKRIYAYMNT